MPFFSFAAITSFVSSFTAAGVAGTIGAISGALSYIQASKAAKEAKKAQDSARGVLLNKESNVEPLPVIYGERRVGGTRIYVATKDSPATDWANEYLYICLALCEGEVESITNVHLNDVPLSDSRFTGWYDIEYHYGTDDQTASTLLQQTADWTSSHRLRGVAYIALRLWYNQDIYSGIPEITAVVKGRKVYDPRTALTAWSDNPALCIRDYLTNNRYGKGLPTSAIDDTAFSAAATDCEESVTLYSGGGSGQLFQCNAVIDTGSKVFDNLNLMLTGCRGFLPYTQGTYSLKIDGSSSSVFDFTTDNIIDGIQIKGETKGDKYNRVTVKFPNPDTNWQPDVAIYPEGGSSEETAYLAEDGGELLHEEIELETITNYYSARDLARVILLRSRNALRVQFNATSEALQLTVGDVVTVTHPTPGWDEKPFQVEEIVLNYDGTCALSMLEYDSTIYTWEEGQVQKTYSDTNLPNPFTVKPPTNLTVTETTVVAQDGTLLPSLRINWTAPTDAFVSRYEVQWLGTSLEDYGAIGEASDESVSWGLITEADPTVEDYGSITDAIPVDAPVYNSIIVTNTQYVITGITPADVYNIKVRAINEFGVRSAFVSIEGIAEGDTTPPAVPENLTAVGGLREITLSWTNPSDADFYYVEIWENTVDTFSSATKIAVSTSNFFVRTGLGYNVTRYYWIKAVDYSGNISTNTSSVQATTVYVDSDAFSDEVNNLFTEAGAYGIEPVASLPATGDFDGQIKLRTSDYTLWRWDAGTSSWTDDIFTISSGSVTAASFAAGIEPVSVVASLPSASGYTGPQVVFLTTDQKLYRYDSSVPEFRSAISTADLTGTLAAANFANTLRPIEVVSSLPSTGNFEGRQVYLTTDNKLYRHTGTDWTTAVATSDLSGQIVSTQISDDAITTPKLATGAVTADAISAGSIQSAAIATGAITAGKVAAGAIDADNLTANSVVSGKIAAGAISSSALFVDGVIQGTHIQASTIQGSKIAANTITGGLIAAAGIITTAAQIDNAVISGAKIQDAAITTAKIGSLAVDTAKIANQAVTIPSSAFTASGITINQSTLGSVQSVTWTSTGNPTQINFTCQINSFSNPSAVRVDLYLDGAFLVTLQSYGTYAGWTGYAVACGYQFTPSAGSRTLQVRLYSISNNNIASARSLTVLEVKK